MKGSIVRRLSGALIATLVVLGLSGCGSTVAVEKPKLKDLEKSLVMITTDYSVIVRYPNSKGEARFSEPVTLSYRCTGWFVGTSGEIVTAGHCVEFGLEQKVAVLVEVLAQPKLGVEQDDRVIKAFVEEALDSPEWAFLGIDAGDNTPDITSTVIQNPEVEGTAIVNVASPPVARVIAQEASDNGDVALLKVDNLTKETVPLTVATTAPEIGESLTSIGYPGDILDLADRSRERATFSDGTVQSNQTVGGVGSQQVSTNLMGGMSGGPTVNKDFEVVGVNSFGFKDNDTVSFITGTEALAEFLDTHGIEQSKAQEPAKSSSNVFLLVGVGVVVAIAIALLLLYLFVQKSRKKGVVNAGVSQTPAPFQAHASPAASPPVYPVDNSWTPPVVDQPSANGLCTGCSSPLHPSAKFCANCGTPK